ncbi:MAG: hypothetical protein LDL38_05000 [Flavobacterium piscis]|jgi:hypothetical protein|uniref:hypothetical protein n=1 Tax=Flavobacterium sp. KBS0721 TaxID=1179672 RepID=UPI000F51562F|nr:hypothetical protein [Flavobacterium sp. KBS0721]MCA1918734.1 hypothetical protein [Flavobacterium piscis]QDW21392.1 hypothetical protein B0M43_0015135 [Flavobacterium sp. KBS0721]
MKQINIIIIFLLIFNTMFSQDNLNKFAKIDSLSKIDFLSYNYKYLDKDFKFKISRKKFEKSIEKHKFYPERLRNYKDSLGVVLMAEFNDWDAARIAELKITYSWERVGYHLLKNKDEVIEIAKKLNIKYPYRLQELLLRNDPKVSTEIEKLRNKLFLSFEKKELKTMSSKQLLSFAFSNNPELIKLRQQSHKKKSTKSIEKTDL